MDSHTTHHTEYAPTFSAVLIADCVALWPFALNLIAAQLAVTAAEQAAHHASQHIVAVQLGQILGIVPDTGELP